MRISIGGKSVLRLPSLSGSRLQTDRTPNQTRPSRGRMHPKANDMSDDLEIMSAESSDLEDVATLFDAYRVWYGAKPDPDGARNFIGQRMRNSESVIFVARRGEVAVGFTQLYPMFSSVSMGSTWVLNDLFVAESERRAGVGKLLLQTAAEFGRQTGAIRLELQTGIQNHAAQSAYENHGWIRDEEFFCYSLPLQ